MHQSRMIALAAFAAAGVLPMAGANAQHYGSAQVYAQPAPLYP